MNTVPSLSVVICTHNPRPQYFGRVLSALQTQTLSKDDWELLVLDSASQERVDETWALPWHPHARHLREDISGKIRALVRGIRESRGRFIVTVDDDNVLAPDYLEKILALASERPQLGAVGAGTLEAEFEVQPPQELRAHLHLIAVRRVPSALWSNNAADEGCCPWGPGLCVTREVADAFCQFAEAPDVTNVIGPRGQRLFRGDDDLFSWIAAGMGLGFGIFPELRVTHLIPAGRLSRQYFLRLIQDHAFSHSVLRYMLAGERPQSIDWMRYVRLLLHGTRNGAFSMRCQWATVQGEATAARFISEKHLRPLEGVSWLPRRETLADATAAAGR